MNSFIELKGENKPVLLNASNIVWVGPNHDGCDIRTLDRGLIYVAENYRDVKLKLWEMVK